MKDKIEIPPEVMKVIRFHHFTLCFLWIIAVLAFCYFIYKMTRPTYY